MRDPMPGERWRHKNGIPYTVIGIANIPPRPGHLIHVIIMGPNGKLWTRELADWHRSMTRIENE